MSVVRGAGAYICGEETALIESLEGQRGEPRKKPPYPASVGVWGKPTLVNNVETLANVPHIIDRGVEWYTSIGTPKSTGPKLFCVSGHVKQPGLFELSLGVPLRELIYDHAGGIASDKGLKAVIPGGSSTPMLAPEQVDTPMDFESLDAAGSALGTGAVIVMDEDTCMVGVARRLTRFYNHESCGRCTPCRAGTQRMLEILEGVEQGEGEPGDVERLEELARGIQGLTFCPMGDAAVNPVLSSIKLFKDEYEYHIKHKRCPVTA
jgi:NADH-quinone oxidoreductase subunit F